MAVLSKQSFSPVRDVVGYVMPRDPRNNVRRSYETVFGNELGSLFSELWQELAALHLVWTEYRTIFATSPEQLEIANRAASGFFYIVQKVMWEGILLHLARLTDPVKSPGKKENLTVAALAALVRPEMRPEVERLIEEARMNTSFARDWRNRYLAHTDLPLALGDATSSPLAFASRANVTAALASLDCLVNYVDKSYTESTTVFDGTDLHSGAVSLMLVLEKGLAVLEREKLEKRRKWTGE